MPKAGSRIAVVVTAAGSSARFGSGKKELAISGGRSVLESAISPFLKLQGLEALVITAPAGREAELEAALSADCRAALARLGAGRFAVVAGGQSRRDSVRLGLEAVARALSISVADSEASPQVVASPQNVADDVVVLIHDGARPWASAELAARTAAAAAERGAALPVVPLVDTPKQLDPNGTVTAHPPRSSLGCAQTPQGFRLGSILAAHRRAAAEGFDCTDDAELWDRYLGPVAWIAGEVENRKVTYARDLERPREHVILPEVEAHRDGSAKAPAAFRVGQGWDLHRLVSGRRLMLGGLEVPSDKGEEAHSDGDVLLHAIVDALFGAAALGDIGSHFPPSDQKWKDSDSRLLAAEAARLVRNAGWEILNLDCTIVLETPKLGPHKEAIRRSVADCLGMEPDAVSIKAKTKEGVDATGEGRAIESYAIVCLSAAQ
jgi:2-C-methyl-D-erythritol 2,4-cyclodiphosphate synthase